MSTHAQPAPELPEDTGYVCSCLRITECQLLATLARTEIQTLRDLRRATGAGDGCTACHQTLGIYLAAHVQADRTRPPVVEPGASKDPATRFPHSARA